MAATATASTPLLVRPPGGDAARGRPATEAQEAALCRHELLLALSPTATAGVPACVSLGSSGDISPPEAAACGLFGRRTNSLGSTATGFPHAVGGRRRRSRQLERSPPPNTPIAPATRAGRRGWWNRLVGRPAPGEGRPCTAPPPGQGPALRLLTCRRSSTTASCGQAAPSRAGPVGPDVGAFDPSAAQSTVT